MRVAIRIINILALIGSIAWYYSSPGWEPVVVALSLIAVLIGSDLMSTRIDRREPDRKLYLDLIKLLPSTACIAFVNEYDFGGAFVFENLRPLYGFLYEWNDPEHEFHDKKLEQKRKELHSAVDAFLAKIAQYTFHEHHDIHSVPREWEIDNPELYHQAVAEIHNTGSLVAKVHQDFIRLARRRLNV